MKKLFATLILVFAASAGFADAPQANAPSNIVEVDRIVAIANDAVITRSELDEQIHTIKQQLRQQKTQLPPDALLQKQVLERLISNQLQLQLAASTGIRVDDEVLNKAIGRIAEQNKLSITEFRDVLEKDGVNFASFREDIRNEITMTRLRQRQVDSRINVTDQEVARFLAAQADKGKSDDEYRVSHILIAVPEAASPEQIQTAKQKAQRVLDDLRGGADFKETAIAVSNGQQALEGGDLGWRSAGQLPSLFAPLVGRMKPGDLSDIIRSPSGFHIIKLFDYRSGQIHRVNQTLARHILIRTNELVSDDDASIKLEQLSQRIKNGADFAELARVNSEDKGSAVNGGSLGWVSPGEMVPVFEQAMNELQPGQISKPFKSEFGWHIVQVQERREQDNTEQFNRSQAFDAIRQRKVEEELQIWLRRLRDEAYVEYRLDDAL